jgi:hypothetical protein
MSFIIIIIIIITLSSFAAQRGLWPPRITRFLDITQWRTTVVRIPLDEWSARHRDLYLTTHNTHKKHPFFRWDSNPQSQQASGRTPTPLDHAATGIGDFDNGWNILRQRLVKSTIMITCTILAQQVTLLMSGSSKFACCNTVYDVTDRLFDSSREVPSCERSLEPCRCVCRTSLRITDSRQRTQL